MTSEQQIILLDLPSKAPRTAWSLNPWKSELHNSSILSTIEFPHSWTLTKVKTNKPACS